jgi:8-oxo-dGTP pyrophosphatase MutT (NUDIX family)
MQEKIINTVYNPEQQQDTGQLSDDSSDFIFLGEEYLAVYNSHISEERHNIEKRKYKNVYCVNCGEKGHVVKDCDGPITSFGIIAFKVMSDVNEEVTDKNNRLVQILQKARRRNWFQKETAYSKIKFLMIQRKDTMGYIDFVRGKYPEHNETEKNKLLDVCLHEMTGEEKNNLLSKSFDDIWGELWINHESKCFKNEYETAKIKFHKLDIEKLVKKSPTYFDFQEFGFPKGRRNMKETNIACAEREFFEETGYDHRYYEFIKNYPTIHEEFIGTNGIRYRHIYYLVKMKENTPAPTIDKTNIVQTGEVQNIGWFTFDECMSLIRPYDNAKKRVIRQVYTDVQNMKENFVCSDFYYNTRRNNYMPQRSPPHDCRQTYFRCSPSIVKNNSK